MPNRFLPQARESSGNRLAQPTEESSGNVLTNFIKGAGKGVLSTSAGLLKAGEKIGRGVSPKPVESFLFPEQDLGEKIIPERIRTPEGTAQKVGFATEQIGEFFIPAGKIAKAEKALDIAFKGSRLLRIGAKAGLEAGLGAGVTFAQTGEPKEAGKAALAFGAIRAGTAGIGETLRAFNVPEKLYTRIFKNNYKDMISELKSKGINTFAKTHPEQYQQFVKSGIIKTGIGGKQIVNESLAKQALDRGLKGNLTNMADRVVEDTIKLENDARKAARLSRKTIEVKGYKGLADILSETATRYKNVGDGSISKRALEFSTKLRSTGGKLNAEDGLKLRRYLDGVRNRASFDTQAPLSLTQENFKYWSNLVRNKLRNVKGMEQIMDDYVFNIEALESLAREATRRGNNQVLGMMDALLLGIGTLEPTSIGLAVGRRTLISPRVTTNLAQTIQRPGGVIRGLGTGIKTGVSQLVRGHQE